LHVHCGSPYDARAGIAERLHSAQRRGEGKSQVRDRTNRELEASWKLGSDGEGVHKGRGRVN
jgi:hypothetical protein